MLYLAILICAVLFAGVAMTVAEGLWNNAINLICVVLGGLFGMFIGVPVGTMIAEQADAGTENLWYFVFAGVWGVFALSVLIMRLLVEKASRVKMRFLGPVDKFGGPLVGIYVAIMFASFAAYTLDRIPIKAGAWKYSDGVGFPQTVFQQMQRPFFNLTRNFAKGEDMDPDIWGTPVK
jgi:hypothetical protein